MRWKKGNTLLEFKYLLFCSSIDLFDAKDLKEIWQMVIWSENVFKDNLLLQFSCLEEFGKGKVSGWWTLDELQYENGWKDQLKILHTHF